MGTQWQYGQYTDVANSNGWPVASTQGQETQLDAEEQACHEGLLSLAASVQGMLPSLSQPQHGSTASAHLMEKQLNDKMSQLRTGIRDLELLAEEQDNPDKAKAVEAMLKQHRAEYERLRLAISDAKRAAQIEVERSFAEQRKALLSGAALPPLLRAPGNQSEAIQTAAAITDSLRRTRQVLAQQLEHVANNTAFVETGNTTLSSAQQELQSQNPVIQEGKRGMRTLERQSHGDRWLIWAGLWVFLLVAVYVGLKRAPAPVRAPIHAALNMASKGLSLASRNAYHGTSWAVQSAISIARKRRQAQADEADDMEDEYQMAARRKAAGSGADQDQIIQIPKPKLDPGHTIPGGIAADGFITTEVYNDTAQQQQQQQQHQGRFESQQQEEVGHDRHQAGDMHAKGGGPLHFASDRELRVWLEQHVDSWDALELELPRLARNAAEKAHVMGVFADVMEMQQMMREESQQQPRHAESGTSDDSASRQQQQQQPLAGDPDKQHGSTKLPEAPPEDYSTGQKAASEDEDVHLPIDDEFMARVVPHSPLGVIAAEERAAGTRHVVQAGKDEPPAREIATTTSEMGVRELEVVDEKEVAVNQQAATASEQQPSSAQRQHAGRIAANSIASTAGGPDVDSAIPTDTAVQHQAASNTGSHTHTLTGANVTAQNAVADGDAVKANATAGSKPSSTSCNVASTTANNSATHAATITNVTVDSTADQQARGNDTPATAAAATNANSTQAAGSPSQAGAADGAAGRIHEHRGESDEQGATQGMTAAAGEVSHTAVTDVLTGGQLLADSTGAASRADAPQAQQSNAATDTVAGGALHGTSTTQPAAAQAPATASEAKEVEVNVESVPLSEVLSAFDFEEPVIELVADTSSIEEWQASLLASSANTDAGSADAAESILGTADVDKLHVLDPTADRATASLQGTKDTGLTAAEERAAAAAASDEAVCALVVTRPGSSPADIQRCKELLRGGPETESGVEPGPAHAAAGSAQDAGPRPGTAADGLLEQQAAGIQQRQQQQQQQPGQKDNTAEHLQTAEGEVIAVVSASTARDSSHLVNHTSSGALHYGSGDMNGTAEQDAMAVVDMDATHATVHVPLAAAVDMFGTTQLLVAEQAANLSAGVDAGNVLTANDSSNATAGSRLMQQLGLHGRASADGIHASDSDSQTGHAAKDLLAKARDIAADVAPVSADETQQLQEGEPQAAGVVVQGTTADQPASSATPADARVATTTTEGTANATTELPQENQAGAAEGAATVAASGEDKEPAVGTVKAASVTPAQQEPAAGSDDQGKEQDAHKVAGQTNSMNGSAVADAELHGGLQQSGAGNEQGGTQQSSVPGQQQHSSATFSKAELDSIAAQLAADVDSDYNDNEEDEDEEEEQAGGVVGYEEEAEEAVACSSYTS